MSEIKDFTKPTTLKTIKRLKLGLPAYTAIEEILNAFTHGLGVALSIVAIVLLILFSDKTPKTVACISVYTTTLFILYIISTLYHALPVNGAKKVFRVFDHCSIFLLIAGTYTPICLLMLDNTFGLILLSIVVSLCIFGTVLNCIDLKKYSKISMACYITIGWLVVIAMKPLLSVLSFTQIMYLFTGGVLYTLGAILYALGKNFKYVHSVWHLFVLSGSIMHFMLIFDFIRI